MEDCGPVCPTCERKLVRLEDFPLVYVSGFEKIEIPSDLEFPYLDGIVFVGPNVKAGNPKPPLNVLNFFKDNRNTKSFFYRGWNWELETRDTEKYPASSEKIKSDWKNGFYHRSQDQRNLIVRAIDPYLDYLESIVKNEVPVIQLLPKFKRGPNSYLYNIPKTAYGLMFSEVKSDKAHRISTIAIDSSYEGFGESLVVGKIFYQGRLKK